MTEKYIKNKNTYGILRVFYLIIKISIETFSHFQNLWQVLLRSLRSLKDFWETVKSSKIILKHFMGSKKFVWDGILFWLLQGENNF